MGLKAIKSYEQYDKFFRLISYIVSNWCIFTAKQTVDNKNIKEKDKAKENVESYNLKDIPKDALPVIHFEKLVTFIFRFWHKCLQNSSPDKPLENSFGFLELMPAQPGIRVVKRSTDEDESARKVVNISDTISEDEEFVSIYRFINDMLYNLQEESISHYLEVTVNEDTKKKLNKEVDAYYTLDAENHKFFVRASAPITGIHSYLKGFNEHELELVDKISNVIQRLSPSQIRALGTHCNKAGTHSDVEKEFKDIFKSKYKKSGITLFDNFFKSFSQQDNYYYSAFDIKRYLDEVINKSNKNKKDYEEAFNAFTKELTDEFLLQIFNKVQAKSDEIWSGDEKLLKCFTYANKFIEIIKLVLALGYYKENKKLDFLHKLFFESASENLKSLSLPSTIEPFFQQSCEYIIKQGYHQSILNKIIECQVLINDNILSDAKRKINIQ